MFWKGNPAQSKHRKETTKSPEQSEAGIITKTVSNEPLRKSKNLPLATRTVVTKQSRSDCKLRKRWREVNEKRVLNCKPACAEEKNIAQAPKRKHQCESATRRQHFLTCGCARQQSQQTADFYHTLHCDGGYTLLHYRTGRKHLSIMFFVPAVHQKTIAADKRKLSYLFGAVNFTQSFQRVSTKNANGNKIESKYLFGWNSGVRDEIELRRNQANLYLTGT